MQLVHDVAHVQNLFVMFCSTVKLQKRFGKEPESLSRVVDSQLAPYGLTSITYLQ